MKAIFDALNIVYDEEEKRSFIKLNLMSLTFTLGAIGFILVRASPASSFCRSSSTSSAWAPGPSGCLPSRAGRFSWSASSLGLALLYRYGPSRDKAEWRWVTPGGIVAAVLWLVVSMLFSWYVANFGSYNETYGSLGAVIGFMTWIWISTIVVLLGAEINAEMEHQTAKDTTEGSHQPMGTRGAQMADTVGVAKS